MELLNTHPVKTSDLGLHGNLFGGKLLAWLDAAAVAYVSQLCDSPRMVTASIKECNFIKPVKKGQLVKIYGAPAHVGTSSITVKIEVRSHNVIDGAQKIVLDTSITFVKIDEDSRSQPISQKAKSKILELIKK